MSTLDYAFKTNNIRNSPVKNKDASVDQMENLRKKNQQLEF